MRISGYRKIFLYFTTDISEREIKCGAEKIVVSPYNGQIFCEFWGKEKIIPSLYNGHFLVKRLHHFEKNFLMYKTRPFILQRTFFDENLAVLFKISLHLITDIRRRKIKCAAKKVLHYTTRVFESKSRCPIKISSAL